MKNIKPLCPHGPCGFGPPVNCRLADKYTCANQMIKTNNNK